MSAHHVGKLTWEVTQVRQDFSSSYLQNAEPFLILLRAPVNIRSWYSAISAPHLSMLPALLAHGLPPKLAADRSTGSTILTDLLKGEFAPNKCAHFNCFFKNGLTFC